MVRKIRKDFPGAWHHVMHRGARREPIFLHDEHCLLFLELAESVVQKYEVEFHGYSLMPNHYHILARSRHGNLSDAMGFLNGRYTQRVNRLHRWDGPVFRGRFTSKLVRDETSLPYILAYIHLNPLRANLVTRIDSRCWTSMRAYLGRKGEPDWLVKKYFFLNCMAAVMLCVHIRSPSIAEPKLGRIQWIWSGDFSLKNRKKKSQQRNVNRHSKADSSNLNTCSR
jgi:putative transposase